MGRLAPGRAARGQDTAGLDGVLVTAGALPAQREHAAWLRGRGAHYLVTVKGNQSGLHRQLRSLPWKDVTAGHVQDSRGHGRIERRTVKAVTVAAGIDFPHAVQAIQVTRKTRRAGSGKWRTELSYAVISLPAHQAGPAQVASWLRGHWKIENQLHWVRHVTYGEDASHARTGNGRTSWPACGTWPSASCAWAVITASPPPCATSRETRNGRCG